MSAPTNLKQPKVTEATTIGVATRYANAAFDDATLQAVTDFVHRMNGTERAIARAYALWVDELVVYRDPQGAIRNVFGFRFLDVGDVSEQYRVLYSAFSCVDERAGYTWAQLGHVGMEVFHRECLQHDRLPVIWATAFAGAAAETFMNEREDVHGLAPGVEGALPRNLRFYTNEAPQEGLIGTLPHPVEAALQELMKEQRQLEQDARQGKPLALPWWRRLTFPAAGIAVAACAAFFILSPRQATQNNLATRMKGGANLHVFRQIPNGSEELLDGARASAGTTLEFAVDLPAQSRVQILDVDSSGKISAAWPLPGRAASPVLEAGEKIILDGAVKLDGSVGREALYLVTCPPQVSTAACESAGASTPPSCAPECSVTSFALQKTAP